jgi:hypothetical protein
MRSSTSNKYIGLWDYDLKDYLSSDNRCVGVGGVWTLAEVAAAQAHPSGYFWPTRPVHEGAGPDKRAANATICSAAFRNSAEIVDIRCGGIEALCAGANTIAGSDCESALWAHKLGFQWEFSSDKGTSWFRFPDTAKNLLGEKIFIGMAAHYMGAIDSPTVDLSSAILPEKALRSSATFSNTAQYTQFYGVVDSVRVSRGIARYTTPICQPYDPRASANELIDDFVIFALNIGDNPYRVPGGTVFPYYVKGRGKDAGWLVPGQAVYNAPDNDVIAPSLRNFYPHARSSTNVIYATDNNTFSPPIFTLQANPNTEAPTTAANLPVLHSGGDPYFNNVWLLLHMDGTDGSTTFTDSSLNNQTPTLNLLGSGTTGDWGTAAIALSSVTSPFSGSSAAFSLALASSDYCHLADFEFSYPISPGLLTTNDWVIEFWAWFAEEADSRDETQCQGTLFFSGTAGFEEDEEGGGDYFTRGIRCHRSYDGILTLSLDGGEFIFGNSLPANTWAYITVVYSAGVFHVYQDGTRVGFAAGTFRPGPSLVLGNQFVNVRHIYSRSDPFQGYIDEFRVTIGTDRGYTTPTIPVPVEPFPDSDSSTPRPPAPTITSVVDNVSPGTAPIISGGVTNDSSPTFNGTTSPGATSVRVSVNGGAAVTVSVTADAWEFTPATALADGAYTFSFKAVDASDVESAPANFSLTVDTISPLPPTITSVTDNSLSSPVAIINGGNAYDSTPTFTGTVAADVVTAQVSVDGGAPIALTLTSNAWSFTPATALTAGPYVFSFTATDSADNESAATTFSLTVSEPEAPDAPTSLNTIAGDEFLLITWTAPNPNGAEITSYTIEYTPAGNTAQTVNVGGASTTYRLDGLENDRQYSVRVAATNSVGTGDYSSSALATPIDNPPDPYFSDVVLLLHMDGTNGSTTFTDSSSFSRPLTRSGNPQISTTEKLFGSASAYFNGSSSYVLAPASADFDFSANDFTIEGWVYNTHNGYSGIIGSRNNGATHGWCLYIQNNILRTGSTRGSAGYSDVQLHPTPIAQNSWTHFAVVKTAAGYTAFINGVAGPVLTDGGFQYRPGLAVSIGALASEGELPFFGYIDDLRVTRNIARYTTPTFDVPDAPFPDVGPFSTLPPPPTDIFSQPSSGAIVTRWKKPINNGGAALLGYKLKYVPLGASPVVVDLPLSATSYALSGLVNGTQYAVSVATVNALGVGAYSPPITVTPSENPPDSYFGDVALLVHFNGDDGSKQFDDYSLNNYTLTSNGNAQIGAPPLGFDRNALKLERSSSSYVSVNETALTSALLTSDFTMECWFRATAAGGSSCLMSTRHDGSPLGKIFCVAASWPRADINRSPRIWCGAWDNNVGPNNWRAVIEGPVFDLNTWYHVAMTVTTDGQIALYVNGTKVGTATGAVLDSTLTMRELLIGRRWDNVISNFTGDQFFDGFIDDVRITNAVRYTEATEVIPARAFPDYGPLSTVPTTPVDFSAVAGDGRIWLSWLPPVSNGGSRITGYRLEYFAGSGFPVVLTLPVSPRRYIISDAINGQQYTIKIAAINAVGRSDFSPPINVTPAEITDGYFASVVLLLRMDEETFLDSSKYSSDIMRFGAELRTDRSAFGTRSGYFAGTGRRIEVADNDAQFYFDGDYTVEAWLYIPTLNTNNGGWFFSQAENEWRNANRQYAFGVNSNGLRVYWTTNGVTDTFANFNATIPTNEWVHVAFCRVGGVLRAFVNGIKAGADIVHTPVYFNSTASACIGSFGRYRQNIDFVGYISELRVTKDVARYVANFTKPGTPFPDRGPSSSVPQAPTHLSLSSAAEKIFVSWRKPADSGGLAISSYAVTYRALTGPDADMVIVVDTESTNTSYTIELPGANSLHAYAVSVAAVNKAGTGAASAAKTITPGVKWTLSGPTVPVDLEFNKVSLLLHFEGANNSTTFLDSADNRVPVVSGAKINTAQKASGTASGYFENNTLTYGTARNFGFGTGEFTIEMYVRAALWTDYSSVPSGQPMAGNGNTVVALENKITWRLRAGDEYRADPNFDYWPAISLEINGTKYVWIEPEPSATPLSNTWVHVAMTRVGNRLRIYIDGAKKFDQDIGPVNFDSQLPLIVGSGFFGHIDELRITRGFARYAAGNFTPQALPFADRQLTVAVPSRVAKVKAQGKNTAIVVSWRRPFDDDDRSGSRTTGYKIQYTTLDGTEVEINTNSTLTTYTITGLTNYTQYQIRVAAYNETGNGLWSFYIPCTPLPDEFDYIDVHKYLTYTNPDEGYLGKCGIQFPNVPATDTSGNLSHPPTIAQAIVLHDATIPPRAENKRVIYVDCATTGAEKPALIAAADGKFYGKDKEFDKFTAAVDTRVLVKNQSDAYLNGVYTVKFSDDDPGAVSWERILNTTNTGVENYFGTRVVVLNGKKNVGTVWNCANEDVPTIDQTPIEFERDILLGLRQEDFCVEAYFKAYSFRQPPLNTKSLNMTLIDTYYRADNKDTSSSQFSGIRIYFSAILNGKQGYVHVDVGNYAQKIDETAPIIDEETGPALRSKLLSTDVFYHVAVTRADDTFRLYIDGELQDQFVSQDDTYEPLNLTRETNHIRYRVRPYFGLNDYGGLGDEARARNRHISQYGRFNVVRSEFFFKRETVGFPYSERFNGSALMVEVGRGSRNDILNLPSEAGGVATWPGKPIPNYPADAHVYIFRDFDRDVTAQGFDMHFAVAPSLRFPPETVEVDVATVPANAQYQSGFDDCGSGCPPIPNRGNIQLYGIFAQGSQAKGDAAFIFSSSGEFTIPRNLVLRVNGVDFNPRSNYKVVEKAVNVPLAPTEGNVVLVLSSTSPVAILDTLRLQTTAVAGAVVAAYTFAPKQTYNAVFKAIELPLQPNELRIVPYTEAGKYKVIVPVMGVGTLFNTAIVEANSPFTFNTSSPNPSPPLSVISAFAESAFTSELKIAAQNPDYVVTVPVTATTRTVLGNLGPNTQFTNDITGFIPASRDDALIQVYSLGSFSGGADDADTPLTIDGVPVSPGMRVLVKNQQNARENGIYVVSTTAWTRAADMDQTAEIIGENRTRRTFVKSGYLNSNVAFLLDIPVSVPDTAVVIGLTDLSFAKDPAPDGSSNEFIVYVQQSFAVVPVTDPADWQSMKDSVTVGETLALKVTAVSTANLDLYGPPSAALTDNWPIANGATLLVRAQTRQEENGVYIVNHNGPWRRLPALSLSRQFPRELLVSPQNGDLVPLTPIPGTNPPRFTLEKTVAFRMRTQNNFILNVHPITFDSIEEIKKIHLPFSWGNTTKYEPPTTGGLPTSTGGKITWEDFIPDNVLSTTAASNDTVSWRVFLRCGDTIAYSRVVVLRAASKVGVFFKTDVAVND